METTVKINHNERIEYVSVLKEHTTIKLSSGFRLEISTEQLRKIVELYNEEMELSAWLEKRLETLQG